MTAQGGFHEVRVRIPMSGGEMLIDPLAETMTDNPAGGIRVQVRLGDAQAGFETRWPVVDWAGDAVVIGSLYRLSESFRSLAQAIEREVARVKEPK